MRSFLSLFSNSVFSLSVSLRRQLLHHLSLNFSSFSLFSNSVFSLTFMEGLLELLSTIFTMLLHKY